MLKVLRLKVINIHNNFKSKFIIMSLVNPSANSFMNLKVI